MENKDSCNNNPKVSVIIPTYNRFKYLLNTIKSVKEQDYNNLEIIVVNDCSTEKEYYEHKFDQNIKVIHLKENSKVKFGYACAGYVRNIGILQSTGEYVAFCDDDDIWMSYKISKQIKAIKNTGCKISSTDGFYGNGIYDKNIKYMKYNQERYFEYLYNTYLRIGYNIKNNGFPIIWDLKFIQTHNSIITSSVVVEKQILDMNLMKHLKNSEEDYDCWLRVLQNTNLVYLDEPLFYYDGGHGDGCLY
jgi:glycosyltransferase involved in cell wall biosynthesis